MTTSNKTALLLISLSALLSGCASITSSSIQHLTVTSVSSDNEIVDNAKCKLSNDKGHWSVATPGSVMVQKSAADLSIICEKPKYAPGTVRAISKAGAGMFGNIVFGGGIGAVIDHHKGTAYNYPTLITVIMGETHTVPTPKRKQVKMQSPAPAAVVPAPKAN